jgi:hypothetical protein
MSLACPPGGGTTITLELPREPPTTAPDAPGSPTAWQANETKPGYGRAAGSSGASPSQGDG